MMRSRRRNAFTRPAIAVTRDETVAVQDAGDDVIVGDQCELAHRIDDVGRGTVALAAPASGQPGVRGWRHPDRFEIRGERGERRWTDARRGQGRLLAGSEPNGILYRISARDKAFVLYDANLPEIRSIVPMPDGTVYAAALGGSLVVEPVRPDIDLPVQSALAQ